MGGLGGKGLRKRDGKIGPVNPFQWESCPSLWVHPEALLLRVKSSGVRQSKITKGTVLAGLGEKGLRKRDGQIGPINP